MAEQIRSKSIDDFAYNKTELAERIPGGVEWGSNGEGQMHCLYHEDKNPSCSINVYKGIFFCHACGEKGTLRQLLERCGSGGPVPVEQEQTPYDYLDESGELRYQSVRYYKDGVKGFYCRRPADGGGWVTKGAMKNIAPLPYNLGDVQKAILTGDTVFIVEGEKDCDKLAEMWLIATTNHGGALKWRKALNKHFPEGTKICLIPDCDEPGVAHMKKVGLNLLSRGCNISWVYLGYPITEDHGRDVSDWLSNHSEQDFEALVAEAPAFDPDEVEEKPPAETLPVEGLPFLDAKLRDLPVITAAAWSALEASNKPERLFLRAGTAQRLDRDEHGALIVRELTEARMRHESARSANWFHWQGRDENSFERKPDLPPFAVVRDMLAAPSFPLPPLLRIVPAPCFAPDGTLQETAGYHGAGCVFIDLDDSLQIPAVPEKPTSKQIAAARELIITELFGDFPLEGPADMAHLVGLLLLGFVRDMIDSATPLHHVDGSVVGSGKGLAVEVALIPAFGGSPYLLSLSRDDDEVRKALTSAMLEGRGAIRFDNATILDQPSLSALLTVSSYWSDRRLGHLEILTVPVRSVFASTGNNVSMTIEIARRTVRSRIVPLCEKPWEREDFRHPDLRGWAHEHRGELICSALTIIKAWIAAGKPKPAIRPLGSFESWTRTIGGILEVAGIPGFLSNSDELYETADTEGAAWRRFVDSWWESHQDRGARVSELFELANFTDGLDLGDGNEKSQRIKLGKKIAATRDRIFGDMKIVSAGTAQRAALWRLIKVNVVNVMNVVTPAFKKKDKMNRGDRTFTNIHNIHLNGGDLSVVDDDTLYKNEIQLHAFLNNETIPMEQREKREGQYKALIDEIQRRENEK